MLPLATGYIQGLALWWLWQDWQAGDWLLGEPAVYLAILYAVIPAPLAIYCTHGVAGLAGSRRSMGVAAFTAIYACLSGYAAWAAGATATRTGVHGWWKSGALAARVLGFVGLSLFCGFDVAARRWN